VSKRITSRVPANSACLPAGIELNSVAVSLGLTLPFTLTAEAVAEPLNQQTTHFGKKLLR
jgi:hypothetical protein